ncbi:MAG TPA: S8 family serine peptidase [Gammaproteobacteria bacterium]|nr:S8 family serine peptidase [Gammaproteobacteria bacterium]
MPDVSDLAVPGAPLAADASSRSFAAAGEIQVVVQLSAESLAVANGRNAKQTGARLDAAQGRQHLLRLDQDQNALLARIRTLGGREGPRLTRALNAVIVSIDAAQLPAVRALPGVTTVRPVRDYRRDLSATVPYIGAAAVQSAGTDGTGVRVAVLDSGIDYTHKSFGGPGTAAAYAAAYGASASDPRNTTTDGLFPTAKVVGGFDFVGETWPVGALAPDPDPIDCGPAVIALPCDGGHGTHVADIIGGNDGASHKGVAPGVSLYAVKVCSAISTSCSGVALLEGIEFALDPNGDGDVGDAVDVINLSLGSAYGQIQDSLTEACSAAAELGVVVVAAAGNDADRPYIVSSPSIAPQAISVAQTQVPSAVQNFLSVVSPPAIGGDYIAVFQSWSAPLSAVIQAPVQYGTGAGANLDGCAAFPPGSLTGKIVLVDRGICAFTDKIRNVAAGGGLVGVIGLVAPGEPFEGAFAPGPAVTIPGFMVSQSTSNAIKGALAAGVIANFDPNNKVPLVMSVVSGSARGPSYSFNSIKPDIGAPGASVSADAGTGTGQTAFGGTSGATPMVAGSAALLLDAHPGWSPLDVKAALMNTAETRIAIDPATQPGVLAPITRIGGGEVRVNRAFSSKAAAWDAVDETPSLSFGYSAVLDSKTFLKVVALHNYNGAKRTYSISPSFRYASDEATGAIEIVTPPKITVPAGGTALFPVVLKTDGARLPLWTLNGGARGGDGFRLQGMEFDGFITLSDGKDDVHVPWHVLPHRAAAVIPQTSLVALRHGVGSVVLKHANGTVPGRVDAFSLLGRSARIPRSELPEPGDDFAIVDLKFVGARLVSTGLGAGIQFAVNTFRTRSHPNYPAEFDIFVDSNRDGEFDFAVFNLENGGFAATGQNVVAVVDLATNAASVFFFTDADLDSANAILTAPLAALGLTPTSTFDFSVFAFDNYFTGNLTDAMEGITYTAGVPRFVASGVPASGVPVQGSSTLNIQEVAGGASASPSQTGILLMYRDGRQDQEADAIRVLAH